MKSENKILLYDFLLVKGGAEKVCFELFDNIDELDLTVAFINQELFADLQNSSKKIRSLANFTSIPGWQLLKACLYFQYTTEWLRNYDEVIFSGSCAPLSVANTKDSAYKVMYCHTPPRFIYDLKEYYLDNSNQLNGLLIKALIKYMQPRYEESVGSMDLVIANSENVKSRLKNYLKIDAKVIYPPCDVDYFEWLGMEDYYLSVARLEPYKRVEVVVRAFMEMTDKKLIVASEGSEFQRLKKLAQGCDNIIFRGWCTSYELRELIGKCIATIYIPFDEDFGMSPVESMSAGKPVIGVNEGGVKETVIHGETGFLCEPSPHYLDIVEACRSITSKESYKMKENCEKRAMLFSRAKFFEAFEKVLARS